MQHMTWTCDRCNTTVTVPQEITIEACLFTGRIPWRRWHKLPDWEEFRDDETVLDVCPDCITAGERADRLFREAELAWIDNATDAELRLAEASYEVREACDRCATPMVWISNRLTCPHGDCGSKEAT